MQNQQYGPSYNTRLQPTPPNNQPRQPNSYPPPNNQPRQPNNQPRQPNSYPPPNNSPHQPNNSPNPPNNSYSQPHQPNSANQSTNWNFEVNKELTLQAWTNTGEGCIFTKVGSWIASTGGDFRLDYVLVGPGEGNLLRRFGGQLMRKFAGENLKLVKVNAQQGTRLLFADRGQHISIIDLSGGGTLKVESENILAFTDRCKYSVAAFFSGTVSQKGLATSTLTGTGPGSLVAVTTNGNPIQLRTPCKVDPDAMVCFIGADPRLELNVGWKNLIGKANGESYYFNFEYPDGVVMIQPFERESGFEMAIDGENSGAQYNSSRNLAQTARQTGNTLQTVGRLLGGNR